MAVPYIPPLDPSGKRVLRCIREHGVVPGWQLMSEAKVTPAELSQTVDALLSVGLISAKGNVSNASEIGEAYFNIQPSSAPLADLVLNAP